MYTFACIKNKKAVAEDYRRGLSLSQVAISLDRKHARAEDVMRKVKVAA